MTNQTQPILRSGQYVSFRVGELLFGIEVGRVQEVLRSQPMTPVPLAPAAVQGLVNLRGQIITAIDMRTLLAMTQKDDEEPPMNVVMRENSEVISLLVDSIGDVLEVSGEEYEAAPDTIPHYLRSIVSGLFKLEEGLLLVVGDVLAATSDKIERQ